MVGRPLKMNAAYSTVYGGAATWVSHFCFLRRISSLFLRTYRDYGASLGLTTHRPAFEDASLLCSLEYIPDSRATSKRENLH
jgi:hypothetical protein